MPQPIGDLTLHVLFPLSPTGLGLSLTKAFVELHHGQVAVESTLGKGSAFRVILPVDCRNVPAVAPASAAVTP